MPTKPTNEVKQEPAKRRTDQKLQRKQKTSKPRLGIPARTRSEKRQKRPKRRRAFPIWLRIIVVLILCVIALITGMVIGYGIIGDGNPRDALDIETWRHILDLIESQN